MYTLQMFKLNSFLDDGPAPSSYFISDSFLLGSGEVGLNLVFGERDRALSGSESGSELSRRDGVLILRFHFSAFGWVHLGTTIRCSLYESLNGSATGPDRHRFFLSSSI